MQEDAENQNAGVDQTTDSSTVETTTTVDSQETTGTTDTVQNQSETATTETVPDLASLQAELESFKKKAADFEGMGKKWQNIAKDLRSQQQAQAEAAKTVKPVEEMDDWERIDSMLDSKLGKLMGVADDQERTKVIDEFSEMPFTKELGPEIKAELDTLDADPVLKGLPFKTRMGLARNNAIANNAALIAEIAEGRGLQKAYDNQSLKQKVSSGTTETSNATVVQSGDDILSRISSMSTQEYLDNYAAIDAAARQAAGVN